MTERKFYLDNLKGILIILVIVGHAIQFLVPNYEKCFAFRFIYSFHMPLFFLISGYLANRGCFRQGVIKRRAIQLLLPFVTWAFISPLLNTGHFDAVDSFETLIYPDRGLWFLYNLFVYSLIYCVAEWINDRMKVNKWIVVLFAYLILAALMFFFRTKFNCTQLCYHYVFFIAGCIYRCIRSKLSVSKILPVIGIAYFISVPFWTTNGSPLFYDYINLGNAFAYMYRYGVQILGMFFFFELGSKYLNKKLFFITDYGKMTLGVYALQFPVLYYLSKLISFSYNAANVLTVSVVAIFTCFVLHRIIDHIPYVNTILLGAK